MLNWNGEVLCFLLTFIWWVDISFLLDSLTLSTLYRLSCRLTCNWEVGWSNYIACKRHKFFNSIISFSSFCNSVWNVYVIVWWWKGDRAGGSIWIQKRSFLIELMTMAIKVASLKTNVTWICTFFTITFYHGYHII